MRAPPSAGVVGVRNGHPAAIPDLRRLGRRSYLVAAPLLAGGGAAIALLVTAGSARGDVGPGRVEIEAAWTGGETSVRLPPFGSIAAQTNGGPLGFDVGIEEIDISRTQALLADPRAVDFLQRDVRDGVERLIRSFAVRVLVVAFLGGAAAAAALPHRHWWTIVIGAMSGLVAVGSLLAITWSSYDPDAFTEPTFEGPLEEAPELIARARQYVDDFSAVQDRISVLSAQVADLYATSITDAIAAGPGTRRILHISDVHLNPVGLEVTRQLATEFDVAAIVDSGDLTTFGSPLEARFGQLLEDLPVPYYLVGGNHDARANRAAIELSGSATVLDFDEARVIGLDVLGVGHPSFTASNELDEEEVLADLELQTTRVHAEVRIQQPDILVVHDPLQAETAIGEVPLVLAGHVHRRSFTIADGTIVLTVGSTGATGLGSFTVETDLAYEAEILYFDDDSLVAVDNIALRGTNGDFRVDRRLVDDEEVRASRADENGGTSEGEGPGRPVLPGVLGDLQAADPARRLWCPVPL